MKFSELSKGTQELLKQKGVVWDEKKKIFMTRLHNDLYLSDEEMKSEAVAEEFAILIDFLNCHLEFGVDTGWAASSLNKSVYLYYKRALKVKFPLTVDSLSRFYDDSDVINFYKSLGALSPITIDLVGTTGAGKTTFCQQFVDDESKELLTLTITDAGESTVIQTDILILEKTERKMFLKARNKADIMRDVISVALEIDFTKNGPTIASRMKKPRELRDKDIIDKVSNFYSTPKLLQMFITFAKVINFDYDLAENKADFVQKCSNNPNLHYILDDIVYDEYIDYLLDSFYGYRFEIDLETDGEMKILTTIANTAFKSRKEDPEAYPEFENISSRWLLFESATLVLPCGEKAKKSVDYDFQQGLVFRDSRGHNLDEQAGLAADFEVKNKIFLIPVDSSGYLIDERYSNLFEKILISEPENNIFVLTKIDINTTYRKYKKSGYLRDKDFNREFAEKLAKTHDNMLNRFRQKESCIDRTTEFYKDETNLFRNFMSAFDNAYLSEVEEDICEAEGHKIVYTGNSLEEFDKTKVNIEYLVSWFDIISGIISKNKLSYFETVTRISKLDPNRHDLIVKESAKYVKILVDYYTAIQNWSEEVNYQLYILEDDFRYYYQSTRNWYQSSFINDGNSKSDTYYFNDFTAKLMRDVKSYAIKGGNTNFFTEMLVKPMQNYLSSIYRNKGFRNDTIKAIAEDILSTGLEKAVKISFKVFDRDIKNNIGLINIKKIYDDESGVYIKPMELTYDYVLKHSRRYYSCTEEYLGIYCNLLSKSKYNLKEYLVPIFESIISNELEELDKKVK